MRSEDMRAFAENVGAEPRQLDGDAFARLLKESTARWGAVASKADLEKQ